MLRSAIESVFVEGEDEEEEEKEEEEEEEEVVVGVKEVMKSEVFGVAVAFGILKSSREVAFTS